MDSKAATMHRCRVGNPGCHDWVQGKAVCDNCYVPDPEVAKHGRRRSGNIARLNRQERRWEKQANEKLPERLEVVARVAASRAGGRFFTKDQLDRVVDWMTFVEAQMAELKKADADMSSELVRLRTAAQPHEPAQPQPQPKRVDGIDASDVPDIIKNDEAASKLKLKFDLAQNAMHDARVKQEISETTDEENDILDNHLIDIATTYQYHIAAARKVDDTHHGQANQGSSSTSKTCTQMDKNDNA